MTTFLALYRGQTIAAAQLVAVSADPALVAAVADRLLTELAAQHADPVLLNVERGRRAALRQIRREAGDGPSQAD